MNKVIMIGNVGQDPTINTTEAGKKVAALSLATSETYKNQQGEKVTKTEWHNLKAWEGKAELIEKYVFKGHKLAVEGKLQNSTYEDEGGVKRYRTEVLIESIEFLTPKDDSTP